jgi:hypothetical protein
MVMIFMCVQFEAKRRCSKGRAANTLCALMHIKAAGFVLRCSDEIRMIDGVARCAALVH